MTPPRPVLSFVIPVRNGAAHLDRLLASIARSAALAGVAHEVVIGDNGSTDETARIGRTKGARVIDVPVGRASAVRNAAATAAQGRLLSFIDADHELDPEWCTAAVAPFEDPSVTAIGAQYHAPSDGTWVQRTYDKFRRRSDRSHDVEWLPSGNLVVRREVFDRLGGFDAGLDTCEDVDVSHRLRRAGGRLVAVPTLRSVHFGDPRTLRALFVGELWRGRDNWRVTAAGPWTARALLSLMIPFVTLVAVAAIAAGTATAAYGGWTVPAAGATVLAGLVLLRALPLLFHGGGRPTLRDAIQAVVVSGVYNVARALALVARGGHHLRRSAQ